jgi:siroheme synthase-like protein
VARTRFSSGLIRVAKEETMSTLPVTLNLPDAPCLVVGGGEVALRRVRWLLEAGFAVEVVAPRIQDELGALAEESEALSVSLCEYDGRAGQRYALVVAATDTREVNVRVGADAAAAGVPVNLVDDPAGSTFRVPALLRRGDLTIAVDTAGASPALAGRIRDELDERFPVCTAQYVDALGRVRMWLREACPDEMQRRAILRQLASAETAEACAQGTAADEAVLHRARSLLRESEREALQE